MSTADTEGTSLEDLLLTVLRSGTPLGNGFRDELTKLMIWLTEASASECGDALPATDLLNALLRLRVLGNSARPDPAHGDGNGSGPGDLAAPDAADALDAAGAAGLAGEVTDGEAPGVGEGAGGLAVASASDPGAGADAAGANAAGADAAEPARRDPAEAAAGRLRELWASLGKDPVAGRYCLVYGDPPDGNAAAVGWLWKSLFLTCLRLPGGQADLVRELAEAAVDGYPDRERLPSLVPGEKPGGADLELGELRELASGLGRWPGLAGDVLWLAWLAWHDEGAKCAYQPTIAQGIADFDEDIRLGFTVNMRNKLSSLCADASPEAGPEADQLVLVDEALRGIVPVPLPQPGSWWTARLEQSERRLGEARHAGRIRVVAIDLGNLNEWDGNFDKSDVVAIRPEEAAGDYAATFNRVWILRYPVQDPRNQKWKKGRYIAVK